jgi:hypothetical protein
VEKPRIEDAGELKQIIKKEYESINPGIGKNLLQAEPFVSFFSRTLLKKHAVHKAHQRRIPALEMRPA